MADATQSYFLGPWQMTRIIENVGTGVIGEVWGQAEFLSEKAGLTCRESGVLRFHGHDYHTGRTSRWRFPGGGRIAVDYEDGRPFHDFLMQRPISLQFSGKDRFEIRYDFDHGTWSSTWEMSGPSGLFMMTTRYRR